MTLSACATVGLYYVSLNHTQLRQKERYLAISALQLGQVKVKAEIVEDEIMKLLGLLL
ncbi:hypothetical protein FOCG_15780 [Fusarium oxysporum f. sp. radicis-lycopersici 26381]|nr:hypothetical protein FOWG_14506 [Fusarium oxysporum f. sp. lycopersici MN25]EXL41609.1 hypothetical protein FOCG_15780 [Fusarium oxysporum f. sp. radicis-lycopersici 26381]